MMYNYAGEGKSLKKLYFNSGLYYDKKNAGNNSSACLNRYRRKQLGGEKRQLWNRGAEW